MKKDNLIRVLFILSSLLLLIPVYGANGEVAKWEAQAKNVSIVRDDWGIAHVTGKTDADAIFGMIYAQAEDDFNRVETNYLNSMGRLAEAEGESAVWHDLRMKIFIQSDDLKKKFTMSPAWLQKLMTAWADGLNFYLAKNPQVKPRVINKFEPWMALSFTEGSIGGDIESINLGRLQSFYGNETVAEIEEKFDPLAEPSGSNGMAIAPKTQRTERLYYSSIRTLHSFSVPNYKSRAAKGLMFMARQRGDKSLSIKVLTSTSGGCTLPVKAMRLTNGAKPLSKKATNISTNSALKKDP